MDKWHVILCMVVVFLAVLCGAQRCSVDEIRAGCADALKEAKNQRITREDALRKEIAELKGNIVRAEAFCEERILALKQEATAAEVLRKPQARNPAKCVRCQ